MTRLDLSSVFWNAYTLPADTGHSGADLEPARTARLYIQQLRNEKHQRREAIPLRTILFGTGTLISNRGGRRFRRSRQIRRNHRFLHLPSLKVPDEPRVATRRPLPR